MIIGSVQYPEDVEANMQATMVPETQSRFLPDKANGLAIRANQYAPSQQGSNLWGTAPCRGTSPVKPITVNTALIG